MEKKIKISILNIKMMKQSIPSQNIENRERKSKMSIPHTIRLYNTENT